MESKTKVVGRRVAPVDALATVPDAVEDARAWHKAFGGIPVRRGVYRFTSHAEADEWLLKAICRPRVT